MKELSKYGASYYAGLTIEADPERLKLMVDGQKIHIKREGRSFVLPSRLFPNVNGTLASLPMADALDAFSTPGGRIYISRSTHVMVVDGQTVRHREVPRQVFRQLQHSNPQSPPARQPQPNGVRG
jgi:hypothetical protein